MVDSVQNNAYPESSLLVGAAESIWSGGDAKINIGIDVSEKLVVAMGEHLPERLDLVFITDSDIRHIKRKHGSNEENRGQLTVTPSDFANIPEELTALTHVCILILTSSETRNFCSLKTWEIRSML